MIVFGEEKTTIVDIIESLDQGVCELHRKSEVGLAPGNSSKIEEPMQQVGIVVQIRWILGVPFLPGCEKPVFCPTVFAQKIRSLLGKLDPVWLMQLRAGLGQTAY